MKNYYINEKLFAIGSKFNVLEDGDIPAFVVESDKFDLGKNISIYNLSGEKLLYFKQKIPSLKASYRVLDNKKELAFIKKNFIGNTYKVTGALGEMLIKPDNILGRKYNIILNDNIIGRIEKELTFGRDRYTLSVIDENYTNFLIGVLVMVDMVKFSN
ncbi:LURP-one-related/scramblase family protein [Clostridium chrysemydis]|uniref:LURP-one-related/scramblase family protein n=1 Tax=Clostridium chrysemydis TaxID=2665504 RepID=UPI0018844BA5|nr:LURP-one-related family protein [Clostridium chrysemydis]